MSGPYAAYVIGAYAIAAGSLAAVLGWALADRRAARKALQRAERAAAKQAGAVRDEG